jgi:hypothetical protein
MVMCQYLRSVTSEELDVFCRCPEDEVSALLWNEEEFLGNYFELGSLWDALRFLLTGRALTDLPMESLLDWATLGNHSIGEDDRPIPCSWMGVRYLLPDEVYQVSEALSQIPRKKLIANYAPQVMNEKEVHGGGDSWTINSDRKLDCLLDCYESVKEYYQQAASEGKVMLMYMPF